MTKSSKWLAENLSGVIVGIVTTVIGGLVVWVLTLPQTSITFEGMVYDSAANMAVPNAMIALQIAGVGDAPWHCATDNQGSYKLIFNGLKKSTMASIQVAANGFSTFTVPPFAIGEDNRRDVALTRNNAAGGGGGLSHPTPLKYIPIPDAKAPRIQIRAKP